MVAAALTVTATLFAVSGAGSVGPASPTMLALLGASLLISAGLAGLLILRIVRIAGARSTPETGARLHLRFVSLFSAAAVAPAVLVALFLGTTMSRGVEEWFSDRVETVVENGAKVGRNYIEAAQENLRGEVIAMATDLNGAASGLRDQSGAYAAYLDAQTRQRFFASAYVINHDGKVLAAAQTDQTPTFSAPGPADFNEAAKGQLTMRLFEDAGLIRALYRLDAYDDAYLYVTRFVDPEILVSLRSFEGAVVSYREAEDSRARLQIFFALAYLATAVLVLLAAVWLGLSNASRVAEPIGRLAEAAGRVASGDLAARVAVGRERDEVDALARAFNRMTAQIEAQRNELVSARRDAEDRSSFTQAVLSNVSAGVIGLDRAGRITAANSSAAELLGVGPGELDGRRLVDIAPEFGEIAVQEAGVAAPSRIDLSRSGETVHLSVRVSGGGASGVVLTFDDMTKLIAAQRQEAWKDVARRIAHEIKNPLTPIQLSAERLQRKYGGEIRSDPETFQRCTSTILRQVADIGRMVDEFSGFARMPTPRFQPADLSEIAREAVFAQRLSFADVRFEIEGADLPSPVTCDGRLIGQALTNVLKNAGEAIQGKRLKDGEPKEGRVVLNLERQGDSIVVSIHDNGPGFPAQDRDRLVEPYVTTRTKGTGLGLAIVQRVVEDHGGSLALGDAPPPGPGALVRIALPMRRDAASPDQTAQS
ncbi:MAG: two-component system NtrC family nitrogen regulation sensor histidine kinase NtrY [Caulobacteraceae bacterium]|nr:MAG: two-component system NtrC family nitrogen regulation sensor histidine kinase NtrY [Caulobacteraceae bacterium]